MSSKSYKSKAPEKPKKNHPAPIPNVEMAVKLYFQQNWLRDVRIFKTDNRTEYRKFVKAVKTVLKLRDSTHILLKWQDDSGDLVTLSSDLEMQLATKHIRHNDTLNIIVQLLDEVSAPTLCDKCDQTIICNIRYKCDKCPNFVCCVRCYQAAQIKTNIHEHELYKEKYPCYCPMHCVRESDVPTPQRPISAIPFKGYNHHNFSNYDAHRNSLGHLPSVYGPGPHQQQPYHYLPKANSLPPSTSTEDLLRGMYPSAPASPYPDFAPSEHHNFRTAEKSEVLKCPGGEIVKQQQMQVFESPDSGVIAIRSRKCKETRSKSHQLG